MNTYEQLITSSSRPGSTFTICSGTMQLIEGSSSGEKKKSSKLTRNIAMVLKHRAQLMVAPAAVHALAAV